MIKISKKVPQIGDTMSIIIDNRKLLAKILSVINCNNYHCNCMCDILDENKSKLHRKEVRFVFKRQPLNKTNTMPYPTRVKNDCW